MILGTPKILRKAQKITNFEFEAHKKGDLIQLNCFLFFWKTSLIRVSSQMFNESVQVYESFCPDVKRLKIVLEMFQCAMPLMLFNICHIFVSQISKHLMFRRLNVALSKAEGQLTKWCKN